MHALEYLAAGLIMIIFISFSSAVIMPNVYIPVTHIKEQQLDVLAERITDKILLTPGAPYDWDIITVTKPVTINGDYTLLPDGDIARDKEWSINSSPYAYLALKDNDDNTCIYTSSGNKAVKISITDPPKNITIGNITSLTVWIRAKRVGGAGITIKLETTGYSGTVTFNPSTVYEDKRFSTDKDFTPSKSSWNWTEVKNLNITITSNISGGGSKYVYCAKLWIVIGYKITYSGLVEKELNGFGLALYDGTVKSLGEPYILDRDKVLRLTNKSLQLNPVNVTKCLGLMEDDHLKYGFNIKIKPAIHIYNLTNIDNVIVPIKTIRIKAINYEGSPLANANVYGVAVVFYIDKTNVGFQMFIKLTKTNVLGEADVIFDCSSIYKDLSKYDDYTFLYITCVDFYGLRSYRIDSPSNVETPAFVMPTEDGIMVLHDPSELPRGSIHMRGVFAVSLPYTESKIKPEIYKIWVRTKGAESLNIINHGGKSYTSYTFEGVEQEINVIGIYFKYTGKFHFYIASLRQIIGEELNYGTSPSPGGKKTIVVAKRLVRIEGMDYVFEFRTWRMAED